MSKEYINSDGSRINVDDTGAVMKNGEVIGQVDQFGNFVSSDGQTGYHVNMYGDIVSNNGGKNAGQIRGNRIENPDSAYDFSGFSSGRSAAGASGSAAGCFSVETVISIVIALLCNLVFGGIGIFAEFILVGMGIDSNIPMYICAGLMPILLVGTFILVRRKLKK